jgi:hypothetical protein
VVWVPPGATSSAGREAVELAASAGLELDPWQQWLLEQGLAERADGNWSAFEIVEVLPRQNGKGGVLEAVALACLYLFGDRFTGWSAHEFKTCREGFLRVCALVENTDALRRRARKPRASHGEEELQLLGANGPRLKFMARSMGAGRGFTGDRLILDEAQHLGDAALEAILPTMSARPNPQVWYAATAPDPQIAPCEVLGRLRRRALKGDDPSLVYAEWSIESLVDDPSSVHSWAKANPALGIRISVEHVAREFASMSAAGFARERLGVGNWPTDAADWQVIPAAVWQALADPGSQIVGSPAFAVDANPDRTWASIGVAGRRADGLLHVELMTGEDGTPDHRRGTTWVVPRLKQLADRWQPCAVVIAPSGPANSLIPEAEAAGLEILKPSVGEIAGACGAFYDATGTTPEAPDPPSLRHLDQADLNVALAGALKRELGDRWLWARKGLSVDISPLVAVTLAAWGHATRAHLGDEKAPEPAIF